GSLAGKHEDHRRTQRGHRACLARTRGAAQASDHFGTVGSGDEAAMIKLPPPRLQGERRIREVLVGSGLEVDRETLCLGGKRRRAAGGQGEQMARSSPTRWPGGRRLLEDQVGVGSAQAKGADAGAPWRASGLPGAAFSVYV